MAPREAVLDLYSPVLRCAPSGDRQGRATQTAAGRPADAAGGATGTSRHRRHEYVRYGSCTVRLCVKPLGPWRTAHATARRTGVDWAPQVKAVAEHPRNRPAEYLPRGCDNLNAPTYASFYRAFPL